MPASITIRIRRSRDLELTSRRTLAIRPFYTEPARHDSGNLNKVNPPCPPLHLYHRRNRASGVFQRSYDCRGKTADPVPRRACSVEEVGPLPERTAMGNRPRG